MKPRVDFSKEELSFRSKVHSYRKRMTQISKVLAENPHEWGRFQSEFNQELNGVFRDIMNFEKENLTGKREDQIYKLKRLFIRRIRQYFLRGEYIVWSLEKPYGYAGDHYIIDSIYRNQPTTLGLDRLFDNYFLLSSISVAVRNRKEDFKRHLEDFFQRENSGPLRIMNLACGPCRDLYEFLSANPIATREVTWDCVDHDNRALEYASHLLKGDTRVQFRKENALRIALKKDIRDFFPETYDYIYCLGLFDYLDQRVGARLVRNLRRLLKENGILAVSNVYDKLCNPSVYFMEWVGDWNLVYRSESDFRDIFIDAGFQDEALRIEYEQQGIMQYMIAGNLSG